MGGKRSVKQKQGAARGPWWRGQGPRDPGKCPQDGAPVEGLEYWAAGGDHMAWGVGRCEGPGGAVANAQVSGSWTRWLCRPHGGRTVGG